MTSAHRREGAQSQSINWMLLHAVDEDQGVGVDGPGGGQDQRSHASRSSWNRRSTSSHVGALRGPEGKESRNSSTERRDGVSDGRGTKQTSTSWPSCSPGAVISILFPDWTRAVMWRAFCSPSVAVAMDNPPFLKGYYLRPGPPLSTPHGAKSGATPEPRPRARMAGSRQHPNDRSRSRGDSALAPKGSSLRHRVLDHRDRRLLAEFRGHHT